MTEIAFDEVTMMRIDKLRSEISNEMGCEYSVGDLIDMALTALEDVRNG